MGAPIRAIAVVVAVITSATLGVVVAPPEADAAPGPCPDANGVTVVVDFGAFGGGVEVRCSPGDPDTGFAALRGAGFSVDGASRSPSFLCRINGRPNSDPCVMPSPPWAYWSYWIADRGGSWCYSDAGMLGRNPQRGTVEGWSFVSGSGATHAPRSSTFSRIPGAGTTGRDCDAATPATTPTTRPASTRPPSTRSPVPGPASPGTPPAPRGPRGPRGPTAPGGAGSPGASGAPVSPGAGVRGVAPKPGNDGGVNTGADVAGATTIAPAEGSTTTSTKKPSSSTTTKADGSDKPAGAGDDSNDSATDAHSSADDNGSADRDAEDRAQGDEEALSTVALADSGRSGPGSPLGMGFGLGAIAALGGAAVLVNRRRLAVVGEPLPGSSGANGSEPDPPTG